MGKPTGFMEDSRQTAKIREGRKNGKTNRIYGI